MKDANNIIPTPAHLPISVQPSSKHKRKFLEMDANTLLENNDILEANLQAKRIKNVSLTGSQIFAFYYNKPVFISKKGFFWCCFAYLSSTHFPLLNFLRNIKMITRWINLNFWIDGDDLDAIMAIPSSSSNPGDNIFGQNRISAEEWFKYASYENSLIKAPEVKKFEVVLRLPPDGQAREILTLYPHTPYVVWNLYNLSHTIVILIAHFRIRLIFSFLAGLGIDPTHHSLVTCFPKRIFSLNDANRSIGSTEIVLEIWSCNSTYLRTDWVQPAGSDSRWTKLTSTIRIHGYILD